MCVQARAKVAELEQKLEDIMRERATLSVMLDAARQKAKGAEQVSSLY